MFLELGAGASVMLRKITARLNFDLVPLRLDDGRDRLDAFACVDVCRGQALALSRLHGDELAATHHAMAESKRDCSSSKGATILCRTSRAVQAPAPSDCSW